MFIAHSSDARRHHPDRSRTIRLTLAERLGLRDDQCVMRPNPYRTGHFLNFRPVPVFVGR